MRKEGIVRRKEWKSKKRTNETRRRTIALLGLFHSISDADELLVDVSKRSSNGLLDGLSDSLLDETACDGRKELERKRNSATVSTKGGGSSNEKAHLVEPILLGISDGDLESPDLCVNALDLEDGVCSTAGGEESHGNRQTFSGHENVGESRIAEYDAK